MNIILVINIIIVIHIILVINIIIVVHIILVINIILVVNVISIGFITIKWLNKIFILLLFCPMLSISVYTVA